MRLHELPASELAHDWSATLPHLCPLTDIDEHHQRLEASPAADHDLNWNSDIEEDVKPWELKATVQEQQIQTSVRVSDAYLTSLQKLRDII